jgi:hypothetical protein
MRAAYVSGQQCPDISCWYTCVAVRLFIDDAAAVLSQKSTAKSNAMALAVAAGGTMWSRAPVHSKDGA